jgi:hypothetical protein
MELFYLYNTINDINLKTIQLKNKIVILVDPWHNDEKKLDYGIQTFNWKFEEDNKVMSYKKVPHFVVDSKVTGTILHSNIINKEQMLLNLQNSDIEEKPLTEILEDIKKSVEEEIKFLPNTSDSFNNMNLFNVKKQLMLTDRFLLIIENYLIQDAKPNDELLHKIDYILQELNFYFERDEVLNIIEHEFKENQIIDALGNLLNMQIKITEKINKFNL